MYRVKYICQNQDCKMEQMPIFPIQLHKCVCGCDRFSTELVKMEVEKVERRKTMEQIVAQEGTVTETLVAPEPVTPVYEAPSLHEAAKQIEEKKHRGRPVKVVSEAILRGPGTLKEKAVLAGVCVPTIAKLMKKLNPVE